MWSTSLLATYFNLWHLRIITEKCLNYFSGTNWKKALFENPRKQKYYYQINSNLEKIETRNLRNPELDCMSSKSEEIETNHPSREIKTKHPRKGEKLHYYQKTSSKWEELKQKIQKQQQIWREKIETNHPRKGELHHYKKLSNKWEEHGFESKFVCLCGRTAPAAGKRKNGEGKTEDRRGWEKTGRKFPRDDGRDSDCEGSDRTVTGIG